MRDRTLADPGIPDAEPWDTAWMFEREAEFYANQRQVRDWSRIVAAACLIALAVIAGLALVGGRG